MRRRLEPIQQLLHRQPIAAVGAHPADAMIDDQLGRPLRDVLLIAVHGERPLPAPAGTGVPRRPPGGGQISRSLGEARRARNGAAAWCQVDHRRDSRAPHFITE